MYLRQLFSVTKIKLVYSNEPKQTNLSWTTNDGRNKTAYKTCLKLWTETQKCRLAKEGVVVNIAEGQ